MDVEKKYRGKLLDVLEAYIKARLDDKRNIITDRVFITHSGCDPKIIDSIESFVKSELLFDEIFVTRAGCTASVHCGPGTIGILFIRTNDVV